LFFQLDPNVHEVNQLLLTLSSFRVSNAFLAEFSPEGLPCFPYASEFDMAYRCVAQSRIRFDKTLAPRLAILRRGPHMRPASSRLCVKGARAPDMLDDQDHQAQGDGKVRLIGAGRLVDDVLTNGVDLILARRQRCVVLQ
jgi:hypothetical protein